MTKLPESVGESTVADPIKKIMDKLLKSTLAATLIPLVLMTTGVNGAAKAIAISTVEIVTSKQIERGSWRIYENYYRDNYERAINRGIIRRPSRVQNENRSLELAYNALERGRREEAALRFAQALVSIEKKDGTRAAAFFEQRLNRVLRAEWGQTLNNLSLFNRIFPNRSNYNTLYKNGYEQAIARGIIRRPSRVSDINEALNLAYNAIDRGNRSEAARRIAQALVMIEQRNGTKAALNFDRELNEKIEGDFGVLLREYLPLLEIILPSDEYDYR